jgi:hypothetical protein
MSTRRCARNIAAASRQSFIAKHCNKDKVLV